MQSSDQRQAVLHLSEKQPNVQHQWIRSLLTSNPMIIRPLYSTSLTSNPWYCTSQIRNPLYSNSDQQSPLHTPVTSSPMYNVQHHGSEAHGAARCTYSGRQTMLNSNPRISSSHVLRTGCLLLTYFHFQIIPSDYSALYISILGSASFVVVV